MKQHINEIESFLRSVCRDSDHPTAKFWQGYWFDTGHYKRLLRVIEKLDPVLEKKPILLDIGSFGEFPLILRKFYGLPAVYANSFEGNFVGYGGGRILPAGHPGIEISFVVDSCDVERKPMPQADRSVDVVTCFEVLEHLRYDPIFMMLEIRRVLRDDGLLILSTPNAGSWESLARVVQHESPFIFSSYFADGSGIGHCKEYAASEIRRLFEHAGFTIEKIEAIDFLEAPPDLRERLRMWIQPVLWEDDELRGQTFFIYARKGGPPKMRMYAPLYTENVPFEK